jgi:hypothetical protein
VSTKPLDEELMRRAALEVDRSLLEWFLGLSVIERLRVASGATRSAFRAARADARADDRARCKARPLYAPLCVPTQCRMLYGRSAPLPCDARAFATRLFSCPDPDEQEGTMARSRRSFKSLR